MESCNRTHIIARPELVTFLYMTLRQQKVLTMTVRFQIVTDLKRRTVPQQSLARDCVEVRQQLLHYHHRNISNGFAKHGHKGSRVFRTAYASFSWSSFAFQPKHLRNVSMQLKGGTSITVQVRHAEKICCGRLEGSCRKKKGNSTRSKEWMTCGHPWFPLVPNTAILMQPGPPRTTLTTPPWIAEAVQRLVEKSLVLSGPWLICQ